MFSTFGRYIFGFLILNIILNLIYRVSPILGLFLFFGFVFYSLRGSFGRVRYTASRPTPPPASNFKKDPNVIDAEYQEHKTN